MQEAPEKIYIYIHIYICIYIYIYKHTNVRRSKSSRNFSTNDKEEGTWREIRQRARANTVRISTSGFLNESRLAVFSFENVSLHRLPFRPTTIKIDGMNGPERSFLIISFGTVQRVSRVRVYKRVARRNCGRTPFIRIHRGANSSRDTNFSPRYL